MEVINPLNDLNGAITGIAAIITALATIVLGIITWHYVRLTNRLLKATTNSPRIAVYLCYDYENYIMMCVENIGTGPCL